MSGVLCGLSGAAGKGAVDQWASRKGWGGGNCVTRAEVALMMSRGQGQNKQKIMLK